MDRGYACSQIRGAASVLEAIRHASSILELFASHALEVVRDEGYCIRQTDALESSQPYRAQLGERSQGFAGL